MTERFIPHGAECEADDGRGSDFGKCGEPARAIVEHEGRDRYVCGFHLKHYKPEAVKVYHAVLGPVVK